MEIDFCTLLHYITKSKYFQTSINLIGVKLTLATLQIAKELTNVAKELTNVAKELKNVAKENCNSSKLKNKFANSQFANSQFANSQFANRDSATNCTTRLQSVQRVFLTFVRSKQFLLRFLSVLYFLFCTETFISI